MPASLYLSGIFIYLFLYFWGRIWGKSECFLHFFTLFANVLIMENLPANDFLTREQLAIRWQCSTKTIDRLRALPKANARHLKATTITAGIIRFRLKDVKAYESRFTNNSLLSLTNLSKDDELAEWIRLARLAGLLEEDSP